MTGLQPHPPTSTPLRPRQHRLALVLGSGGVRSMAALGIADVLARAGIRPDLVVGCSSGALFGAVLACGWSTPQAVKAVTSMWSEELTTQRRWQALPQLLVPRLAGFSDRFALRDSSLIAQRITQAFAAARIEDLPTTLRIAATDAASGRAVVLSQGELVPALLASMALPFVFAPVRIDGRLLVDGVISDPLPIAAAADAEVLVTLGFEGTMPRRITRPSRLLARVSTAMTNNLMRARIDAAQAAGRCLLPIDVPLNRHVGLWQTEAMPYLFEAGRRAAEARLPELQEMLGHEPRRYSA
jgi:NTE family protein